MKIFKGKYFARVWVALLLIAITAACVYLDTVEGPETAQAGETVNFQVEVRLEPAEGRDNERLVIAFLAPNSWDAADNTTLTYTSNVDDGVQTMSLVPEDDLPSQGGGATWKTGIRERVGVGPNVLSDMEWVVFWTDKVYNVSNGEKIRATINVETTVGPDNLRAKLGFFINNTGDGLTGTTDYWKVLFTDCFEVTGGEGAVTDFCELHFNFAQPLTATKDDILTIKFQGDIADNPLNAAEEIHFCGTAYTVSGNSYEVCGRNDQTRMKRDGQFGNTYSFSFWPADYFDIPDGEELDRIEYSFVNRDGSVELMNDDGTPFLYLFKCD